MSETQSGPRPPACGAALNTADDDQGTLIPVIPQAPDGVRRKLSALATLSARRWLAAHGDRQARG